MAETKKTKKSEIKKTTTKKNIGPKNKAKTTQEKIVAEPKIERISEEKRVKPKHSRLKNILKTLVYFLGLTILTAIIVGVVAGFGIYLNYSASFKEAKPRVNTTQNVFYDKNGTVIYESYGAKAPQKIELSKIPDLIKKATIAAEDDDFYRHGAIDIKGLVRAAANNLKSSQKSGPSKLLDLFNEENYTQGGSTITQQLVKNLYLSNERSFERKIKEVIYSIELEKKLTKDQILEEYLNNVYYGEQALGIKNASEIFYGKELEKLNLAEVSMLVGLPAAPTRLSPISGDFTAAKKRQEYVLSKMYWAKYIALEEAKSAANESLYFNSEGLNLTLKHPYFVDMIKKDLVKKIGQKAFDEGGLQVYTTLDPEKQKIAENESAEFIRKNKYRKASNAAVVILDNQNGTIAGLVGGVDWEESKINIALSPRQPGSSFKPIVYSAGLKKGYTASTILWDSYVNFGGIPAYRPRNYDGSYRGYITLRKALANSLNIPAVEMTKLVGVENVIENAKNFGISSINNDPNNYGLSIGLGSAEVSPIEMARAYSAFANQGKQFEFTGIKKIKDQKGEVIYAPQKLAHEVIDPKIAYIMSSILSDNEARSLVFGRNNPLTLKNRPVAAKTGTTDDYADSWTIGYTPQYTVATWVGNNDRTKMARVSGFEGAAYIWQDVMKNIHANLPVLKFEKPEGITTAWVNPRTGSLSKSHYRPNYEEVYVAGTEPKEKNDLSYLDQFKTSYKIKQTSYNNLEGEKND